MPDLTTSATIDAFMAAADPAAARAVLGPLSGFCKLLEFGVIASGAAGVSLSGDLYPMPWLYVGASAYSSGACYIDCNIAGRTGLVIDFSTGSTDLVILTPTGALPFSELYLHTSDGIFTGGLQISWDVPQPTLTSLYLYVDGISSIVTGGINCPALIDVYIHCNATDTAEIDAFINAVYATSGATAGNLDLADWPAAVGAASLAARTALIGRGWGLVYNV
jgi:hypothetical protein